MKSYVIIKFGKGLFVKASNDCQVSLIGYLLADDISIYSAKKRIHWLLNTPPDAHTSSNHTFMEKEDGKVVVSSLFDKDPYERAFIAPIPAMIDLLEQWDDVCKTNPDEVTIYYEDGKFKVEGRRQENFE